MTPAIQQSVEFPASPETLFELYLDSKKHSAATGSKAKLGRKAGQKFTAFEGMLEGKNLLVIPNKLIVQAWRSTGWKNRPRLHPHPDLSKTRHRFLRK